MEKLFKLIILLLYFYSVNSQALETSSSFKYHFANSHFSSDSYQQSLNFSDTQQHEFNFRYLINYTKDQHRVVSHYVLNHASGSAVALQTKSASFFPQTNREDENVFNLTSVINSSTDTKTAHSLDRFYYGYYSDNKVFKIGRQAISFGNGLVFQPIDMLNPFSPNQLDTEYKPGVDMLYGQYLADDGSDYSVVIVPRRNTTTKNINTQDSSFLYNSHVYFKDQAISLMVGQDRGNNLIGMGSATDIGDFTLQSDLLLREYDSSNTYGSLVINAQTTWQWGEKMATLGIEYYYNGIGDSKLNNYQNISTDLKKLLASGQVFTVKQNYLASNMSLQLDELSTVNGAALLSSDDGSLLLTISYLKSLSDNSELTINSSFSPSQKGSEFGGLETSTASNVYLNTGFVINLDYKYYF